MKKFGIFFVLLFILSTTIRAQNGDSKSIICSLTPESEFSILGTSTLHDWEVKTADVTGTVILSEIFLGEEVPPAGTKIDSVLIKVPVAKMDGGRGKVMNDKIVKALSGTTHPQVIYSLKEAEVMEGAEGAAGEMMIQTNGILNIGGVEREMALKLTGKKLSDYSWQFAGGQKMKMSDFDIETPSAMFGQIVTGDEITVNFSLIAMEESMVQSAKSE